MRPERRAYDDAESPQQMSADCREVARRLPHLARAARRATGPAPSLRFEDFPREVPKREIRVDDAASRLADALHLHLD